MAVDQQTVDLSQFTLNDIHVGTRLYAALVAHARATRGAPVFYSDLLDQAKKLDTEDAELQRAVPVGIGMKLLFVEAFCVTNGYPNLACLAVSKARGRPGDGYTGDWEADKRAVAEFDWSTAQASLDAYVVHARLVVTPKRRRSYDDAKKLRWDHYSANRQAYAGFTEDEKMEMLNLLIEGFEPDAAYRRVAAARISMQEGQ
jgi:hypothetical protein